MRDSPYSFVNNFSNLNPRIRILLFLDSAKAGLLKYVQNRGKNKTKVGTFFKRPVDLKVRISCTTLIDYQPPHGAYFMIPSAGCAGVCLQTKLSSY